MDDDRRQWLERLAQAAACAAEELRRYGDPLHRELIADLVRLHESVSSELVAAGHRDAKVAGD